MTDRGPSSRAAFSLRSVHKQSQEATSRFGRNTGNLAHRQRAEVIIFADVENFYKVALRRRRIGK